MTARIIETERDANILRATKKIWSAKYNHERLILDMIWEYVSRWGDDELKSYLRPSYPTVKLYEVEISDGVIGWTHGATYEITEGWIPNHNLCFNVQGESLNVFPSDEPRNPINLREVSTTWAFVNMIKNFHDDKKTLKYHIKELQSSATRMKEET